MYDVRTQLLFAPRPKVPHGPAPRHLPLLLPVLQQGHAGTEGRQDAPEAVARERSGVPVPVLPPRLPETARFEEAFGGVRQETGGNGLVNAAVLCWSALP